jgi:hypothetical protein
MLPAVEARPSALLLRRAPVVVLPSPRGRTSRLPWRNAGSCALGTGRARRSHGRKSRPAPWRLPLILVACRPGPLSTVMATARKRGPSPHPRRHAPWRTAASSTLSTLLSTWPPSPGVPAASLYARSGLPGAGTSAPSSPSLHPASLLMVIAFSIVLRERPRPSSILRTWAFRPFPPLRTMGHVWSRLLHFPIVAALVADSSNRRIPP